VLKTRLKQDTSNQSREQSSEAGFSLMETAIALVLMTIVGLGAASLFYYSVRNTSSTADRILAMSVAQQKLEQLRNVAFTDSTLTATTGTTSTVTRSGRQYSVVTTITDSNVVSGTATLKTITVRATPVADTSGGWATSVSSYFGSVKLMAQRTALTVGPNRN
jgi:Tfp pilus assembly protein PilV